MARCDSYQQVVEFEEWHASGTASGVVNLKRLVSSVSEGMFLGQGRGGGVIAYLFSIVGAGGCGEGCLNGGRFLPEFIFWDDRWPEEVGEAEAEA